mgnify:CR=1 FL=1|tara:strand:+ start:69 stop:530 length:462 start_codon:yes stop_codon:yes gene_type:complete
MISKVDKFKTLPIILEVIEDNEITPKWKRSPSLAKAQKKYYEANKSKLIQDQIKYNYNYVRQSVTCECGDIHKYSAKYLHLRSERHNRRMKLIVEGKDPNIRLCNTKTACECGSSFLMRNKKQHLGSKKHKAYLEENKNILEENIIMKIEEIN